ncbi:hypothetical protein [Parashewanella tropica]|uniref:hypothetical protein n=1 Tax=Parashewanella tropica TaxID=2547970 RepID=UPI0010598BF9|nr:hypothetical protein [Parashewanella tropica]
MKELVSAVSQTAANRLKSPIIGSFVLSWLAINHKAVLTFFFSSTEKKLEQLQHSTEFFIAEPSWYLSPPLMVIVYPFTLAIAYTFLLPLIQHIVDSLKFDLIDLRRLEKKHENDLKKFKSLQTVSKAQAESSIDYWKEKLNRDLDNWDKKREEFESDLAYLRSEKHNLQTSLSSVSEIRESHEKKIKSLELELKETKSRLSKEKERYISDIEEYSSNMASLVSSNKKLEDEFKAQTLITDNYEKLLQSLDKAEIQIEEEKKVTQSKQEKIEKVILDSSRLITILEEANFLNNLGSNYTHIYKSVIFPQLERTILPIKQRLKEEENTLKAARLKESIAIKESEKNKEITKLKNNLQQLDSQSVSLWD